MDPEASQKIYPQLSSGESLLWSGRPRQGVFFRTSDFLLVPFSLLWGGFAIAWEYAAFRSGAPTAFLLFGAVFVAVGLYLIAGRFFVDALKRGKTYYGVSNDRVLIVSEFPTLKVKSLALSTLTDVTFSSRSNQSGTITFGSQGQWYGMLGTTSSWPGMGDQGRRFDGIKNVKSVYDIIQKAQRAPK